MQNMILKNKAPTALSNITLPQKKIFLFGDSSYKTSILKAK